ncbi:hydroxymethylglutaryl-CoA synthase [Skeletonema marinoi]|uniref:Hydroxymethylglutaryl-CoA synthase n=1 Tax=Skeletonema marinoi TaxID=267567 RepID=A0AAD9D8J7_9STRA|nr:hydroxymethylglutaryl-CoA synthase [Skeletonema marinoi]
MTSLAVGAVAGAIASSAYRRTSSFSSPSKSSKNEAPAQPRGNGKNVGILAMEIYTPRTYISQSKLEEHSGVSQGRYTLGLGQEAMAVTGDAEDVNSMALTVTHALLEKYKIDPNTVGRLEVGTETLVDKSKSTKTVLMDLFPNNTDIEGATVINACYVRCLDGRYAIVVAVDIATYARGPARPTCGAGAVAVLVGRNSPLALVDPRERATHASNVYDFFKPDHSVEYPVVDGALSQVCYYRALEDCYTKFCNKVDALNGVDQSSQGGSKDGDHFDADSADYFVFHAPYNKLVQKSYGRMHFVDARRKHARKLEGKNLFAEEKKAEEDDESDSPIAKEYLTKPIEDTYSDKALEGTLKNVSKSSYNTRLTDANAASKIVGNTYTASVFFGLASLVDKVGSRGELTSGKTAVVFSYGSGALATMYRLHIRDPTQSANETIGQGRIFTIDEMVKNLNIDQRLASREQVHPQELDLALETRARMHRGGAPYSPVYPTNGRMFPGTYYLNGIDSKWRRSYSRVPLDSEPEPEGTSTHLAPPMVLRLAKREALSTPVTGVLEVLTKSVSGTALDKYADAKARVACVITGTSAGMPYGDEIGKVFDPSNLQKLVEGKLQCIRPISGTLKMAMLDKNVVQLKKLGGGKTEAFPVSSDKDVIKVAAQLGTIDLTDSYGVPAGLAETMDIAAQVAVAAGLEALKSAGLVSGKSNDPSEWKLPEQYRDSTGVVYASSFPAMDAAVGEVMNCPDRQLADDDEAAFARLLSRVREVEGGDAASDDSSVSSTASTGPYQFDRKFLFRVLVLGNAQLAQLAGCRGPNTQTNAACAGTTQAIGMAQDMLISGRAERVVVVAGDNGSGGTLLPWLGSGFRALGAATTEAAVEDAACPFDRRRSGMIMGAGGIGMVLETESSCQERMKLPAIKGCNPCEIRARLLATQYSNSAFHGAALDRKHIASELNRFLSEIELIHGVSRAEIATHGVYFSHETSTHASAAASCAGNEIGALRAAFGDELLSKLLILNTKGFTGHPMGVSFEDVAAVEVLMRQVVPPMPNYKERDEYLGDIKISKGGAYACRYALRFAAGFGSQVAFALYASSQHE